MRQGRLVKGVRFQDFRDVGHPVTTAKIYDAQGADELLFLDIAASREDRGTLLDIVERTASELDELRTADAVLLASGSAARSLASQGGAGDALVVCIGPKTATAAHDAGLPEGIVADEASAQGIINALSSHFEGSGVA